MQNIYSLAKPGVPLVIAHKGHSSILPENTIEAVILSLDYAHLTEMDIMLTCDHQIVVFHDNYLSRMTNVEECPEFAHKRRQGKDYGQVLNDWWITDFTLDQLQKLKLKQGQLPSKRPTLWNWVYKIPTLKSFLQSLLQFKRSRRNKKSGLMIELKDQQGMSFQTLVKPFAQLLKQLKISTVEECKLADLPIYLGAFNQQMVSLISQQINLPLLQLIDQGQKCDLNQVSKICVGVGISQKSLIQTDFKLISECHSKNLFVIYWTLRMDELPIPFKYDSYEQVHMKLIKQGIDGIITQFPETTSTIIQMMKYIM